MDKSSKLTSWVALSFNFVHPSWCIRSHLTATAKTNSNLESEQGHPDNLNIGQKCTQRSAKTFSEPGACQGALPHDLFIWEGCGCASSPAGLRTRRPADKEVKSPVKSRLFSQLLVYSGCFLSGMLVNICSFVPFFFKLYSSGEGLLRTQSLFQHGLKFMQT